MNKQFIELLPIETKRLIIDKTTINDIDLILKMDKQIATQQFLGGEKNKTKEERLEFLNKKENKFKHGIASQLTISLKSGEPIGFIVLKLDDDSNDAELSYIFDQDYTKKGYCKEAATKLIDIAFDELKLQRIIADTVATNTSSIKVLEKLDFQKSNNKIIDNIEFIDFELDRNIYENNKK